MYQRCIERDALPAEVLVNLVVMDTYLRGGQYRRRRPVRRLAAGIDRRRPQVRNNRRTPARLME